MPKTKDEQIRFRCPAGHSLRVAASAAGKKVLCPRCEASVVVPQASLDTAEQASPGGPGGQTQEDPFGMGQAQPTGLRLVWLFLSCPGDTFWHHWGRYLGFLLGITALIPVVERYERHPRSIRQGRSFVLGCWAWFMLCVIVDRALAKFTALDWRNRQGIAIVVSTGAIVGLAYIWSLS